MAKQKATREQLIELLMSLHVGSKIRWRGKIYTVLGISAPSGKLCRRDIGLLEDGLPETYMVPGKYLAAGTMIEMSNIEHQTLYAQRSSIDFEIVS